MARKSKYRKIRPKDWASARRVQYGIRDEIVTGRLGYDDYGDYLRGDEWRRIRRRVLREKGHLCRCGARATQIHHALYTFEVLAGQDLSHLYPICAACHTWIEYTRKGRKRPPSEAARIFLARRRRRPVEITFSMRVCEGIEADLIIRGTGEDPQDIEEDGEPTVADMMAMFGARVVEVQKVIRGQG